MRQTGQSGRLRGTGRTNTHRRLGSAGFDALDSDGSLVTTLALVVGVNLLVVAALYPLLAAIGAVGLLGGLLVARYATRRDRQRPRGRRRGSGTPRPR